MRNLFLSPWGVDKNNLIIFFVLARPLLCPFPPQLVHVQPVWCCWRGHRTGPVDEHVAPEPQVSASAILGLVMCNLFLSPWGVDKNNLIIFFVLVRPLFCSLFGNTAITEAGWIKIAEGVAASKSLQNLE